MDNIKNILTTSSEIVILQAENPDGDSLGSSLALEEILSDMSKTVTMHAPVDIPKYLRYFSGWDRVSGDFGLTADLAIIVDTSSKTLLSKTLSSSGIYSFLDSHPVIVIDHHKTRADLPFQFIPISDTSATASCEIIFDLARKSGFAINPQAAEHLLAGILSDSLGLSTESVTSKSLRVVADLVDLGATPALIESKRREFMKKSPEILQYKARLIQRIEYYLDNQLALVHIPWDEIKEYSDQYNPSALVIDEMLLVEGVRVAIAIKTYPDGKVTGKIRANKPVAEEVAGFFGGGGHKYASGFRIYEDYPLVLQDVISATDKALSSEVFDA